MRISGYSDLILGGDYVKDETSDEKLYYILREIGERGKLEKMSADKVASTPEKDRTWAVTPLRTDGTAAGTKGVYKIGKSYYKDITDYSGGYIYLFSIYFAKYVKNNLDDQDNPVVAVAKAYLNTNSFANKNGYRYDTRMLELMHALLYHEQYTDEDFDNERVYIKTNPTKGKHATADGALHQVNYSYTTVCDAKTLRFSTVKYDTRRDSSWNYWYYYINKSTFKCIDGYKGVTMKNWMAAIPNSFTINLIFYCLNFGVHFIDSVGLCFYTYETKFISIIK